MGRSLGEKVCSLTLETNTILAIAATATPKKSETHTLETIFGKPFYTMTTREGIELGILPGVEANLVNVKIDLGLGMPEGVDGGYSDKQLALINNASMTQVAVEIYLRELFVYLAAGKAPPVAKIFATSIKHCQDVVAAFNLLFDNQGLDLKANYLAGKTQEGIRRDEENREILNQVRAGNIHVLVTDLIAIEGLNIPNIGVVINLEPALVIRATQRFGRSLRNHKEITLPRLELFIESLFIGNLSMALAGLTEPQVIHGYDIISQDMVPCTLISDVIEGTESYPQKTPQTQRRSSNLRNIKYEPFITNLPQFEVFYTIEKIAEVKSRGRTSSKSRVIKACEITWEQGIELTKIYRQLNGKFPNGHFSDDVTDKNNQSLGIKWGSIEPHLSVAQLAKEIVESEVTKEMAINYFQIYRKNNNGNFPSRNTRGSIFDENGQSIRMNWLNLNAVHNLNDLKKKILEEEKNNGGPHNAQISTDSPEDLLFLSLKPFNPRGLSL